MGLVAGVTRCLSSAVSNLPQGMSAAHHSSSPHTALLVVADGESIRSSYMYVKRNSYISAKISLLSFVAIFCRV